MCWPRSFKGHCLSFVHLPCSFQAVSGGEFESIDRPVGRILDRHTYVDGRNIGGIRLVEIKAPAIANCQRDKRQVHIEKQKIQVVVDSAGTPLFFFSNGYCLHLPPDQRHDLICLSSNFFPFFPSALRIIIPLYWLNAVSSSCGRLLLPRRAGSWTFCRRVDPSFG